MQMCTASLRDPLVKPTFHLSLHSKQIQPSFLAHLIKYQSPSQAG